MASGSILALIAKSGCAVDEEERYNDSESEEKTDLEDCEKGEWTKVSKRIKAARLPPCWKLRFPIHMRAGLHTPSASSSSIRSSSGEESVSGSSLWQRGQDPSLKLNIIVDSEVTCYCISLHGYSCTPHVYD